MIEPQNSKLTDLADLDPDALAAQLKTGRLEVTVESALSEWGSSLEALVRKLEKGVMDWHEPGRNKTVVLTFVEAPDETDAAAGLSASG